jgi:hypothetical protein
MHSAENIFTILIILHYTDKKILWSVSYFKNILQNNAFVYPNHLQIN